MIDTILNHRSIRRYKELNVAESLLTDVLTAASRASTTGNMQVYSIVVTTDKGLKEKLCSLPAEYGPSGAGYPYLLCGL
jgi:nitroreductase